MKDKSDSQLSLRRRTATSMGNVVDAAVKNYIARPETGSRNNESIEITSLLTASDTVTAQIKTYDVLRQILPDIEMIESVVAAGILNPKDNQEPEFIYKAAEDILGPTITNALNGILKSHFTDAIKIENSLEDIISSALFRQGSYPIMVLPEGTIEGLLKENNPKYSTESYEISIRSKINNILNPSSIPNITIENLLDDNYDISAHKQKETADLSNLLISLTYNVESLKVPTLSSYLSDKKATSSFESHNDESSKSSVSKAKKIEAIKNKLKEKRVTGHKPLVDISDMVRAGNKSVGHPIVFKLPPESVIPIMSPAGDKAITYLVVLDANCNPIRNTVDTDQYTEISRKMRSDNSMFTSMQTRLNSLGFGNNADVTEISSSTDLKRFWNFYNEKFEELLMKEIESGISTGKVKFRADDSTYQLMFSRLLMGLQTRVLCVPPELITYIAFDTNEFGIGKSLIEKNKITGYIRANLQLAGAVGALQNSINHKSIDINLDPNDPNPKRTVTTLTNNVMALDSNSIPTLMAGSPTEMLRYVGKSGYSINVGGDNPKYPQTKCSVSDKGRNVVRPDTEYVDSLRRIFISGLWTTPETIDASLQGDLATPIILNNAINTKRYCAANTKLCAFITQHVVQYITNSSILIDALSKVINDHIDTVTDKYAEFMGNESPADLSRKDDELLKDNSEKVNDILDTYLATLSLTLPKPNNISTQNQSEAIGGVIANVTAILDVIFNEDLIYGLGKDKLKDEVSLLKASIVAREVSKWAKDTGYFKDIFNMDIVGSDDVSLEAIVAGLSALPTAIVKVAKDLASVVLEPQKEIVSEVEVLNADKNKLTGGDSDTYAQGDSNEEEYEGDRSTEDEETDGDVPDLPDLDEGGDGDNVEQTDQETDTDESGPEKLPDGEDKSDDKVESDDSEGEEAPELPDVDTEESDDTSKKDDVEDSPDDGSPPDVPESPSDNKK